MEQNIRKELIRLTINCNANCLFCNFARENEINFINPSNQEIYITIDNLADKNVDYLIFSGGEPLLNESIIHFIKYAKAQGFKDLELQTNALLLNEKNIDSLKAGGLNRLFISLHTHNKLINKKIFSSPYDLGFVVNNIKLANKKGFKIALNPVVNKLTYKTLPGFAKFIVVNFPWLESVSLSVIQPHGRALFNNYLLPDYNEISKYVKYFRDYILIKSDIKIINPYCGLPMCIGDWYKYPQDNVEYIENLHKPQSDANKKHTAICSRCKFEGFCNGIWNEYLQIFGEPRINQWLKPIKMH